MDPSRPTPEASSEDLKKSTTVSLRLDDRQMAFVEESASLLRLSSDGRPNRSRAIQVLLNYAMEHLGMDWLSCAFPQGVMA